MRCSGKAVLSDCFLSGGVLGGVDESLDWNYNSAIIAKEWIFMWWMLLVVTGECPGHEELLCEGGGGWVHRGGFLEVDGGVA